MNILPVKDPPVLELEMQDDMVMRFAEKRWWTKSDWSGRLIKQEILTEVRIPNLGRISDIIIYVTPRKIINVECKLKDYNEVLEQAKDHLSWADYSYICFHADTNLPTYIIGAILKYGIGLILWREGDKPMEIIQGTWNKGKDKDHRKIVNVHIEKLIKKKKIEIESLKHEQQKLF